MTQTGAMLEQLQAHGHLIVSCERAEKLIPHQTKMVLLRFWNDWQQFNDKHYEDKFLDYWQPIRQRLERELI